MNWQPKPELIDELLSRLAAADCGNDDLDVDIDRALGIVSPWGADYAFIAWTRFIENALSLIPRDYVDDFTLLNDCGCWFVRMYRMNDSGEGECVYYQEAGSSDLPLSICYAALVAHKSRALAARP